MSAASLFSGFTPLALAVMAAGLLLASLARGYSGFGFSALLVSSWSLVTEPARAVALALVMEVTASVIQAFSIWRAIPWRRVAYLMGGAALGTPAGVWLLAEAPPEAMKLGIALFVLVAAIALLVGFRLARQTGAAGVAAVGVVSGVANGAVAMGGLPVALFFTADGDSPARMRAALIAYFFLLDLMGLAFLAREELVKMETFGYAVVALPVLVIGMWLGTRHFLGATAESFRRTTLWILIGLALVGIGRVALPAG
ncbi:MAG: hypothetical protein A3F77_12895 [Betaproteobacteria bacterium RIFCSPLOWO2_12_FULL_67_28]|nr:MAG: hypothetical protein A3F77_12895 [Betaproteobacteria bacterium RIFCSPLOWO2_12_FULL_67_28]